MVVKRKQVKLEIGQNIDAFITETLTSKNIRKGISISNLAVTDFKFSDDFNESIEDKVKAEQDALRALNEKTRIIIQAEASAQEMMIRANASAFRIKELGAAKAYAIELEGLQLRDNPDLVKLRVVERWQGALSMIQGAGTTSFL